MRAFILVAFGVLATGVAGILIFACDGDKIEVSCDEIPAGGCPKSGDTDVCAADPSCKAVYACNDTKWTRLATCPDRPDVNADAATAEADTAPPRDASFVDGPLPEGAWGGPGCLDLQEPDCSLGLAATCGQGCCGCEDVFLCTNGAWVAYGFCQDGRVTKTP